MTRYYFEVFTLVCLLHNENGDVYLVFLLGGFGGFGRGLIYLCISFIVKALYLLCLIIKS